MKKRLLAIVLALVTLMAVLPTSAMAASKKNGAVKGNSVSISIGDEGVVMNIKWDQVSGATGYEYAYNLFWNQNSKKSDYTIKTTADTSATIRLKDYGTVDIRVRAYKLVRGRKVYGEWTSGRLKRSQLDKMIVKQLKKKMKTKELFIQATSKSVNVRSGAGEQYGVVARLQRLDECRATGSFKRDANGDWWSEIYMGIDQNTIITGWVSGSVTRPVWY